MAALEPDARFGHSNLGDGYLNPAVVLILVTPLFLRTGRSCYPFTLRLRFRCAMDDSTQPQRGPTTRDNTNRYGFIPYMGAYMTFPLPASRLFLLLRCGDICGRQ
jgi:hypothetical protein